MVLGGKYVYIICESVILDLCRSWFMFNVDDNSDVGFTQDLGNGSCDTKQLEGIVQTHAFPPPKAITSTYAAKQPTNDQFLNSNL